MDSLLPDHWTEVRRHLDVVSRARLRRVCRARAAEDAGLALPWPLAELWRHGPSVTFWALLDAGVADWPAEVFAAAKLEIHLSAGPDGSRTIARFSLVWHTPTASSAISYDVSTITAHHETCVARREGGCFPWPFARRENETDRAYLTRFLYSCVLIIAPQ